MISLSRSTVPLALGLMSCAVAHGQDVSTGGHGFIRGIVRSGGQPLGGARITCVSVEETSGGARKIVERTRADGTFACSVPSGRSYNVVADNGLSHVPQVREVISSRDNVQFLLIPVSYASLSDLSKTNLLGWQSQKGWTETLEGFDRFTLRADTAAFVPITVASSRPAAETSCLAARTSGDPVLVQAWCSRVYVAGSLDQPSNVVWYQISYNQKFLAQ